MVRIKGRLSLRWIMDKRIELKRENVLKSFLASELTSNLIGGIFWALQTYPT
jgi:hypothetical protein